MKKLIISGVAVICCLSHDPSVSLAREPLMVYAAASLSDALTELAVDFKNEYKVDVRLNLGGSTALRFQIENGAPCDVFLAADQNSVRLLEKQNLLDGSPVIHLLINRLVVVARTDSPVPLTRLHDLNFSTGDVMAMADPATAPAGLYAQQALQNSGVYEKVKRFIVPTLDVRSALTLVASGNAKYAIVYSTDAKISHNIAIVYQIPTQLHDPVIYSAAIIQNQNNIIPARNFLSFLQTDHSRMIFRKYGFQSF